MKRILVITIAIVGMLYCYAVAPEQLEGRWVSSEFEIPTEAQNVNMKMKCDFTFSADSVVAVCYEVAYHIEYGRKQRATAYYKIYAEADYVCKGDTVLVKMHPQTQTLEIDEDDVRVSGIGLEDGVDQREMQKQIADAIRASVGESVNSGEERGDMLIITEYQPKKMTALIDGHEMTFKRKK